MLAEVGYEPKPHEVFTAWIELEPGMEEPSPGAFRAFLSQRLPRHAIPGAFVSMAELPTSLNGKLADSLLPRPDRIHRASTVVSLEASTETERQVISVWERVLGTEPIGADDDFFALGGDSLAALEMVVALGDALAIELPEEVVFSHTSPRGLAAAIEAIADQSHLEEASPAVGPVQLPPMTPWEQAFVFEHMNDPDSARQNVGRRYVVEGAVDVGLLVSAIHDTVGRHIPLRKTAAEDRHLLSATEAADVTAGFSPVSEDAFAQIAAELISRPIDLNRGPLLRFAIHPLVGEATGVAIVAHHAVTDASGFDRIWHDIDARYSGTELTSLEAHYDEHERWTADRVTNVDLTWVDAEPERFDNLVLASNEAEPDGYIKIDASFSGDALRTVSGATPMVAVFAGLTASLSAIVDGETLTVGLPISTKAPWASELAGCWLNVVPTHLAIQAGMTHRELIQAASTAVGVSLSKRMAPPSAVNARRRASGLEPTAPQVVFAFSDFDPCALGAFGARHEVLTNSMVRTPLAFFAEVRGNQVSLALEYDGSLVGRAQARVLLESFENAVAAVIAEPTAAAVASFVPLGSLIASSAQVDPNAPAVLCNGERLTYGELSVRADDLAHRLGESGVDLGDKIGVYGPRSARTVAGIVGVLRSGAAYVPLDPDYPSSRLSYICKDAGLKAVVSSGADSARAAELGLPVLVIGDEVVTTHLTNSPLALLPTPGPEDLAYVIYTSGSTGEPKGVGVTHGNITFSTQARSEVYEEDPAAFLMVSSFAFDSSMVGLFWTLTTGGVLVLPTDGYQSDVLHLAEIVESQAVTHLLAVPALYRVLLDEAPASSLRSLETVIVAGEPCPSDLVVDHYSKMGSAALHNEYGPTETTVWSHHYEFGKDFAGSEVPIGTGIPGVKWAAVDAAGMTIGAGEAGELIIGGPGVTAGYIGRPTQSAEVFMDAASFGPLGFSGPLYRTGDLVRLGHDGLLSFVGRVDRQLKVRGFRVEPEQVEAELSAIEGVTDAAVALEGTRLVAWVASLNPGDPEEPGRIRAQLVPRLPEHEVPSVINVVSELPRTVNGKMDRDSLQGTVVPAQTLPDTAEVGRSEDELRVGRIWADVLGMEGIGRHQNFFDLGGDSILNMRIVARMRQAGYEVKPRDVFANPTVAELTATLSAGTIVEAADASAPTVGGVPLLEMQRWFFSQEFANVNHWNQSLWLEVPARMDLDLLETAAQELPKHHEVLRSLFISTENGWTQHVPAESAGVPFSRFSAAQTTTADLEAQIEGGLDIQTGNLMGVGLLVTEDSPTKVFVTIHHLVVDGVSWGPLLDDWTQAFHQLVAGRPVHLGPRSSSQRDWAEALDSWDHHSPWPDVTPVRAERPPTSETIISEFALGIDVAADIEATVVTALARVWATRTTSRRIELVMESHGRDDEIAPEIDLTRSVGWFTSQYPLVIELSDVNNQRSCHSEVAAALDAVSNSGLSYDSGRHHKRLPGLAFNYLGQLDRAIPSGDVFTPTSALRAAVDPINHRPHDVGVVAWHRGGELHLSIDAASRDMSQVELDEFSASLRGAIGGDAMDGSRHPEIVVTGVDSETLGALGSILDDLDL